MTASTPSACRSDKTSRQPLGEDAGFTLIEVVVTLALVALLSVIIVTMLFQFRSINSAHQRNEARVEVEALAGYMEQIIGRTRALPLVQKNPRARNTLVGGTDEIIFVATVRLGEKHYGLRDIRIYVDANPEQAGNKRLMQSLRLRRQDRSVDSEHVELAEIDELRFRYWNNARGEETPPDKWSDHWADPTKLPPAVDIQLTMTRSGHKVSARRTVRLLSAE